MSIPKKLIRITTIPGSIGILLRGQLNYMSADYDVVAISSSKPSGSLERVAQQQGVRAIPVDMTRKITPLKDLRAVYRLYRILRREKPYFVHTHTPKAGLVGMAAAYFARVPVRMHDIAGLPLLVARGPKRKMLEWVERITYAMATDVYPNSHRLREIAIELKFARADKLKVLGNGSSNGVNTEHFNPKAVPDTELEALRAKLGIKSGDLVCIFVGRLVGDKGINELIGAFTALHRKHSELKLILVGGFEPDLDPVKPETRRAIEGHPGVIYVGTQTDVRPYMGLSHLLVFPTYREGFPNVPMEAGAMGLPAIVTDINGCNEIISDGVNGLIIPTMDQEALKDAMESLIKDEEMRTKLAANARPMIQERYEQRRVWKHILQEYRRLEESAPRAGVKALQS